MADAKLAESMLQALVTDLPTFLENSDPGLVLEFPYAKSIGMPVRIEGRAEAGAYLGNVRGLLPGLTLSNITVLPVGEDGTFLLEYHGACPEANNYDQDYATIMRFAGDMLVLFREYWDTTEVSRALSGKITGLDPAG